MVDAASVRRRGSVTLCLVVALAWGGCTFGSGSADHGDGGADGHADGRLHRVVRVVDGDTVHVDWRGEDTTVRIIGIDTPESVSPSTPDECWGSRATRAAEGLLEGRRVAVVLDPSQGRRDVYGRLLAYLDIEGGQDFGEAMIRAGDAVEYTYDDPYARQAGYRSAERAARAADRGLWGACGGPDRPLKGP
ncbi:thermonuclease family protein [Nocardioides mesophilus]|uniref:Thermonuclease family protein n=1 Tax=Nocardioides mesophilus TaxID=433659 RepID=A0A7G9RG36_9ACTN|nr:thermonuclease family protein [Nocardioides mesophilus]QNN54561.1 thermonuclease family protein [Nocardioides mesophilus]